MGIIKGFFRITFAFALLLFMTTCADFPFALFKTKPSLDDDMDISSLEAAAQGSIKYLERQGPGARMRLGKRIVTPKEQIASIRRLVEIFKTESDPTNRARWIKREFDIIKGTGKTKRGNVLVTGYYQPLLQGSLNSDDQFKWPIYYKPDDLVNVDLGLFFKEMKGKRITGRVVDGRLTPYFNRREIDAAGALTGRGLEAVWVDDLIGLFILHVQGSGVVVLPDGERLFVNYAGANGRRYRSIGKLLIDEGAVKREDMSLGAIRDYLRAHPEDLERVLYHNPSYIFFTIMDDGPFGSTGAKLTAGRSAAFDPSIYPKGSIAHITVEMPVVENGVVTSWTRSGRFVFNHDQGGAIKGPGRMDLFFGLGERAEASAGEMKNFGELYMLTLKRKVYEKIISSDTSKK